MINLLSKDTKRELRAARLNVTLRGYVTFLIVVAIAIIGAFAVGYWLLYNEQSRLNESATTFKTEQNKYATAIKQGKSFTSNLAVAKAILANEILFSEFTTNIAKILPTDSSLLNLSISTDDLKKPMTLTVQTTSYDNALKVKDAFEQSNTFEQVNIVSTSTITDPKTKYTHIVNLNVTISKDAFIKEAM